ncbi:MAG TPA: NAD-dependent epimerase/dehydratase family protein [Gemmatimonadaceae bacterium]|nr:NAD-dependent epimerase/dehydratase family protein [Gemmatimonadaceae bacterium]
MRVLLFGATGMIGQGVLRECLADRGVSEVVAVGRRPIGQQHEKLRELIVADLADLAAVEPSLTGFGACFLCLGVTAVGRSEAEYTAVTYDLTLAIASPVVRLNPGITLVYVSGQGADSSERGRSMWARVKGRTENALLALPVRACLFRPGLIIPLDGIRSRTGWYNVVYALTRPLNPLLLRFFPGSVTTTQRLGRAMIAAARDGPRRGVIEAAEINALAREGVTT